MAPLALSTLSTWLFHLVNFFSRLLCPTESSRDAEEGLGRRGVAIQGAAVRPLHVRHPAWRRAVLVLRSHLGRSATRLSNSVPRGRWGEATWPWCPSQLPTTEAAKVIFVWMFSTYVHRFCSSPNIYSAYKFVHPTVSLSLFLFSPFAVRYDKASSGFQPPGAQRETILLHLLLTFYNMKYIRYRCH